MASSFGTALRVSVFGQSHSQAIGCVVEGLPAGFSPDMDELRAFMFERVYRDSWRSQEEAKCDRLLTHLFEYYTDNIGQLPLEYIEIAYLEGPERAVADFISGMTDRYAIRLYRQLFLPSAYPAALE